MTESTAPHPAPSASEVPAAPGAPGAPGASPPGVSGDAGLAGLLNPYVLRFRPRRQTEIIEWQALTPFAAWLITMVRPRRLVELGTMKGDSYCAFCQAIADTGLPCQAFALDTWAGDAHTEAYGPEVYDQLKDHHDPLYASFSRLVRGTFESALDTFEDASIDLLHIDGFHTYEAVRGDFEQWLPKMSRRGVVLFHDTHVRERGFGVHRFWDEVRRDYEGFALPYSNGLGVLLVDAQAAPEPARRLCRAMPATRELFTLTLMNQGMAIVGEAKTRYFADQLDQAHAAIARLWARVDTLEHAQCGWGTGGKGGGGGKPGGSVSPSSQWGMEYAQAVLDRSLQDAERAVARMRERVAQLKDKE